MNRALKSRLFTFFILLLIVPLTFTGCEQILLLFLEFPVALAKREHDEQRENNNDDKNRQHKEAAYKRNATEVTFIQNGKEIKYWIITNTYLPDMIGECNYPTVNGVPAEFTKPCSEIRYTLPGGFRNRGITESIRF